MNDTAPDIYVPQMAFGSYRGAWRLLEESQVGPFLRSAEPATHQACPLTRCPLTSAVTSFPRALMNFLDSGELSWFRIR